MPLLAVADGGSWQGLFESSGDRAVSSVASALAAVNEVDVLSNLDLSYTSTSRGRRRMGSNGSSGGRSSSSTSSMDESSEASSMNGSSTLAVAADESSAAGDDSSRDDVSSVSSSSGAAAEVQKGDPEGPLPVLAAGDDDIYWVSKLHDGLMSAGFYPADDEVRRPIATQLLASPAV
jgi:hypothetical protein